jgi:orotate phosphoribosyltransferase
VEDFRKDLFFQYLVDADAIRKGHFLLASGKHSEYYFQMQKIFEDPKRAELFVKFFIYKSEIRKLNIKEVVGIAMGSLFFAYEIARQLCCEFKFYEKSDEGFVLKRSQAINSDNNILIVEDVITTGSTLNKVKNILPQQKNKIHTGCLIDRRSVKDKEDILSVLSINDSDFDIFEKDNCSLCNKNIPIEKPGSK